MYGLKFFSGLQLKISGLKSPFFLQISKFRGERNYNFPYEMYRYTLRTFRGVFGKRVNFESKFWGDVLRYTGSCRCLKIFYIKNWNSEFRFFGKKRCVPEYGFEHKIDKKCDARKNYERLLSVKRVSRLLPCSSDHFCIEKPYKYR